MPGRRGRPASGAVAVGAASVLLLSACADGGGGNQSVESADPADGPEAETHAPEDDAEETEPAGAAQTLEEFCASDPEITASDRERVMEVGPLPQEEPEQVPMPYQQQLQQDEDFQSASEDGPAEAVPVPEFSALLCDEHAENEARSAALSQWFEFYYYGELTGDEQLAAQLVPADCSECLESLEEIRYLGEGEVWLDSEPMTALLHMWQLGEDLETRIGFVETELPGHTLYDAEGEVDSGGEWSYTTGFEFEYSDDVGHWQLVHVHEASMGEDVFTDEDPQPPGAGADRDAPQLPDQAQEKTAEGTLAALDHWFEPFDYAALTGDSAPIEAIRHPSNDRLSHFYEPFVQEHTGGVPAQQAGRSSGRAGPDRGGAGPDPLSTQRGSVAAR